jgi:hypothetical protein
MNIAALDRPQDAAGIRAHRLCKQHSTTTPEQPEGCVCVGGHYTHLKTHVFVRLMPTQSAYLKELLISLAAVRYTCSKGIANTKPHVIMAKPSNICIACPVGDLVCARSAVQQGLCLLKG